MTPAEIEAIHRAQDALAERITQLKGDAPAGSELWADLDVAQQRARRAAQRLERAVLQAMLVEKTAALVRETAERDAMAQRLAGTPQA